MSNKINDEFFEKIKKIIDSKNNQQKKDQVNEIIIKIIEKFQDKFSDEIKDIYVNELVDLFIEEIIQYNFYGPLNINNGFYKINNKKFKKEIEKEEEEAFSWDLFKKFYKLGILCENKMGAIRLLRRIIISLVFDEIICNGSCDLLSATFYKDLIGKSCYTENGSKNLTSDIDFSYYIDLNNPEKIYDNFYSFYNTFKKYFNNSPDYLFDTNYYICSLIFKQGCYENQYSGVFTKIIKKDGHSEINYYYLKIPDNKLEDYYGKSIKVIKDRFKRLEEHKVYNLNELLKYAKHCYHKLLPNIKDNEKKNNGKVAQPAQNGHKDNEKKNNGKVAQPAQNGHKDNKKKK